jgi:virulence-associated protein VapD
VKASVNFNGFHIFKNKSNMSFSLIAKATQIPWFLHSWKQVQYWLSIIAKATQIQWFSHSRKQVQHWLLCIAKATQIQGFCIPEDKYIIGFHSL